LEQFFFAKIRIPLIHDIFIPVSGIRNWPFLDIPYIRIYRIFGTGVFEPKTGVFDQKMFCFVSFFSLISFVKF